MGRIVNMTELAEILGYSVKTLAKWQKHDAMPALSIGKVRTGNQYDTAQVIEWLIQREKGAAQAADDGKVYHLEAERARLAHHQANKAELEAAKVRGELAEIALVCEHVGEQFATVRARLLAIPSRCAPLIAPGDTIAQRHTLIMDAIIEALEELSADKEYEEQAQKIAQT